MKNLWGCQGLYKKLMGACELKAAQIWGEAEPDKRQKGAMLQCLGSKAKELTSTKVK